MLKLQYLGHLMQRGNPLEKTFEIPLGCKEIQPVHLKDQSWCSLEVLMLKLKLQYFGNLM